MDPQVKENKPGKCPICHMDLTPIQSDDTKANELKLSDQQIYLEILPHNHLQLPKIIWNKILRGVLTFDQEKFKRISARAYGRIESCIFKTIGEFIKVNQPVYELYSEEIAIAKQDYISAYQQLNLPEIMEKMLKEYLVAPKQN
ncbi:MAG: efflux RND transporter periplasmic adaptor subunit [Saprospiraceae bacterium]|nr:efflux RND transporter periplasmic adaptor subunit [Saprospiraceae bacterium]